MYHIHNPQQLAKYRMVRYGIQLYLYYRKNNSYIAELNKGKSTSDLIVTFYFTNSITEERI